MGIPTGWFLGVEMGRISIVVWMSSEQTPQGTSTAIWSCMVAVGFDPKSNYCSDMGMFFSSDPQLATNQQKENLGVAH